jgi:hypothetical protein
LRHMLTLVGAFWLEWSDCRTGVRWCDGLWLASCNVAKCTVDGDPEQGLSIFRKAGHRTSAPSIFHKVGHSTSAPSIFCNAGHSTSAPSIFCKAGQSASRGKSEGESSGHNE